MKKKALNVMVTAFCLTLVLTAASACNALSTSVNNNIGDALSSAIDEVHDAIDDYSNFGEAVHLFDMSADLVSHLDINLRANAVRLVSDNDPNIRITYTPPLRGNYNIPQVEGAIVDGRLSVFEESEPNLTTNGGVLRIYVPRNVSFNILDIHTSAGAISIIEGGYLADTITLNAGAGAIAVEDFTAGNISVEAGAGLIAARGINAVSLYMRTATGAITLSNSSVDGQLTARTSVGAINISNVEADFDNADISAGVGTVSINP